MKGSLPARRKFLKNAILAAAGVATLPETAFGLGKTAAGPAPDETRTGASEEGAASAKIKIDLERRIGTIDRNIYGNFTEHLGRCIYGGIYDPGSPLSDSQGFRKDVLQAAKDLHVTVLRWPGGNFSSGYNWKDGIGPKSARPRRWDTAWQAEESNQFGTDDFIEYARKLGAEPYICVNMGTGTMQDAADWVEYCNATTNTYWANQRRKNGHEEPYGVKLWGLGNEVWGSWQAGHKDASQYAADALEFGKMMRWVDPSIQLVACGGNNPEWNQQVLEVVWDLVDYISLHHYGGNKDAAKETDDDGALEQQIRVLEAVILATGSTMKTQKKEPVRIAADEWNIWYRSWFKRGDDHKLEEIYNLEDALWVGSALNIFQRHCRTVKLADMAQLVNVIAPIMANEWGIVKQTIYYPLQLYAGYSESVALDVLVKSDRFPEMPETPYIDVSATTDEAGSKLVIAAVNRHPTADIAAEIVVEGFTPGAGTVYEVNGASLEATNTFEHPDNVVSKERAIHAAGASFRYVLPAHSVSMMKFPS